MTTTTDLAVRPAATLPEKIEYARFLAKSGLLPAAFRAHPENVLYAYEYGELLGLHPMAAITGIHVIEGRPSISAGLISALVRRAGHRLRVQGDGEKARCQIIRADDPSFTYSAVWDMARAKQAGLLSRTNWQRYPAAMLKARAVSECARDACQEVLLGMAYIPDELGADDDGGEVIHDGFPVGPGGSLALSEMTEDEKDAAGAMTRHQRVEHEGLRRMGEPAPGAVDVLDEADPDDPWAERPSAKPPAKPSKAAAEKLQKLLGQVPLGPDEDIAVLIASLTGHPATEPLTAADVKVVTTVLEDALREAGGDTETAAAHIWQHHQKKVRDA